MKCRNLLCDFIAWKMIFLTFIFQLFFPIEGALVPRHQKEVKGDVYKNITCIYSSLFDMDMSDNQKMPTDLIFLIVSFYFSNNEGYFGASIFQYVKYLDWKNEETVDEKQFSVDEQQFPQVKRYSHEQCEIIYRRMLDLKIDANLGKIYEQFFHAATEKNFFDKLAVPDEISRLDLPPEIFTSLFMNSDALVHLRNNDTEFIRKCFLINEWSRFFNTLRKVQQEGVRDSLAVDFFISIIDQRMRNNKKFKEQFLSILTDSMKNIVAIIPVFKENLIIILKKEMIIFVLYKWSANVLKDYYEYVITDMNSISIEPEIVLTKKAFTSYSLSYNAQAISITLYREKNPIQTIRSSIPKFEPYDKNRKLQLYNEQQMRHVALHLWHIYVTNTINKECKNSYYTPIGSRLRVSLEKIKNIFIHDLNINAQPLINTLEKNTGIVILKNNKIIVDRSIMIRNISRALICSIMLAALLIAFLDLHQFLRNDYFRKFIGLSGIIFGSITIAELVSVNQFNISIFEWVDNNKYEISKSIMINMLRTWLR